MKLKLMLFLIWVLLPLSTLAWQTTEVPFYEPQELSLQVSTLKPHRVELKETMLVNGAWKLMSYTYVTVDKIQAFGKDEVIIDLTGLTVNGTGLDINIVSGEDLSLRARITPKGLPFGHIIESYAFDKEVNTVIANPDIDFHDDLKAISSSKVSMEQKPTKLLKHKGYNVIVWPYVFASMNLKVNDRFVLPGYNSYGGKEFYHAIKVAGKVKLKDAKGKNHKVYRVEGAVKPSLAEARNLKDSDSGRRTAYYVSDKAPYFFGKEEYTVDEKGEKKVTRKWLMSGWQFNKISSSNRQAEIIAEWERNQAVQKFVIPWHGK